MFWLIGTDGGLLDAPRAVSSVLLAPGERVEILLDLSHDAGKSVGLVSAAFAGAGWSMMGGGSGAPAQGAGFELLRFDVTAPLSAGAGTIPTAFEPIVRHDPNLAAQRTRVFELTGMNGMSDGWHRINGLLYDGARIDFSVQRLQLERWQFVNRSDEPHPMHMHGTQFQVLSRSGAALPTDLGWKDTVLVRGQETVQFALRFDVAGQYVLHCHNLEHEDHGMMLNFNLL
jgi:FtsP/CotA-like multicopper oxidase with cupredoxin domain